MINFIKVVLLIALASLVFVFGMYIARGVSDSDLPGLLSLVVATFTGIVSAIFCFLIMRLTLQCIDDEFKNFPTGKREVLGANTPREPEKRIKDWAPIDRIDALRLSQWAAVTCGYDFVADIHDDPAHRPWKHFFFFLKREIEAGRFKVQAAANNQCNRTTLVTRSEIILFYAQNDMIAPALFPEARKL